MRTIPRVIALVAATATIAAGVGMAQDAGADAAPPVESWGDSVTLKANGLALRFPADGVRWEERENPRSMYKSYVLVGTIAGVPEIRLSFWTYTPATTCDAWVAQQEGEMERSRRLGLKPPKVRVENSPAWLPRGGGWSQRVWGGNACHEGGAQLLVITMPGALKDRRAVQATRTLLWYLGDAALRQRDAASRQ